MKASWFISLAAVASLLAVCSANSLSPNRAVTQNQQQKYLDTQPEYTQAWADYPGPPGYLPQVFRNVQYSPGLGFGYVTWSGPINPQSFYVSVQPPYYYRYPPPSPSYNPAPPSYPTVQPYKPMRT